jgi:hypothetical protein
MQVLNLSGCVRVTNLSLCEVARQCPSLTTLYMANCELVTGKVIHALEEYDINSQSVFRLGAERMVMRETDR